MCSSSYESRTYGLHVCPFKKSSCGSRNHIEFYNVNDDGALHINNLKKGEACTYNFQSVCGAPSFQIKNSTDVSVFFTEWQQDKIKTEAPITGLPPSDKKFIDSSPVTNLPIRSTKFDKQKEGHYDGKYWKTWGNTVQSDDSESTIGRRTSVLDTECKKKNILFSVVAKGDAQMLVDLRSAEMSAVNLSVGLLASFSALSSIF